MRPSIDAVGSFDTRCDHTEQRGGGGTPVRQDAISRGDQLAHLCGAIVSGNFPAFVAEQVLAVFESYARGT